MKIFKDFRFEAAHFLPNVPESHKCRRLHGHSYRLRVLVEGKPEDGSGWVMDFADLKSIVKPVINRLDHQCLNDLPGLENPTAENLAIWLWNEIMPAIHNLREIQVNETDGAGCIYNGS
jgi:6-pyruvoyltetrahydropterin/6-carboxytetrahydropterin synthase